MRHGGSHGRPRLKQARTRRNGGPLGYSYGSEAPWMPRGRLLDIGEEGLCAAADSFSACVAFARSLRALGSLQWGGRYRWRQARLAAWLGAIRQHVVGQPRT